MGVRPLYRLVSRAREFFGEDHRDSASEACALRPDVKRESVEPHPGRGGPAQRGGEGGVQRRIRPELLDIVPLDREEHVGPAPTAYEAGQNLQMPASPFGRCIGKEGGPAHAKIGTLHLQKGPPIGCAGVRNSEIEAMMSEAGFGQPGAWRKGIDLLPGQGSSDQSVGEPRVQRHGGPSVANRDEGELGRPRGAPPSRHDPPHGNAGEEEFLHPARIRNVGVKRPPLRILDPR